MSRSLTGQTIRYLAVGGVVYALDVGSFAVLLAFVNHAGYLIANMIAKSIAATAGFFLHKHFTFSWAQRDRLKRQFALYVSLFVFNTTLSTVLVYFLVSRLSLPTMPSRIGVDIVVIVTAFMASRMIVFRST
jgi:putative flippase GtrA